MIKDYLHKEILDNSSEMEAVRSGYGEGVLEAARADKNIVVISADLTESTRVEEFSKEFPERFFQVGVAEQNMAGIAAGLGISGKVPFIASYAVFSPGRNWEQIRTTIAYNNSNVKIAGHHAGIMTGPDGATHQAIEDIATMRVMPNMKVIVPCDAEEAKKAAIASAKIYGPVYLRLCREKTAVITTPKTPFIPGKAEVFWDSSESKKRKAKRPQVCFVSAGPIIINALLAAKELEKEEIGSVVLNVHTIKPLDEKKIIEEAKKCGSIVSVEEHNIIGGLGSAVAELLAKECPVPMEFIGMRDCFGESGDPDLLIEKYGMSVKEIVKSAKKAIKRKS
ncbi:MAG: transketolase C-terminal domain-containing protein [Candidatus Colwellbacteria bacterium]|nr:transketolase C-terminal domain-containing protein [Candidatus Colwellbacteria bacterium]